MNADTMQIFSRNPRGSSYKTYLPEEIERFQKIRKDHAFGPVLAHAPYTMNLASATEKTYEFACTVIREDIRRMDELQIEIWYSIRAVIPGLEKKQELPISSVDWIRQLQVRRTLRFYWKR